MMERKFARIIRDDAAGVDDDTLRRCALPLFTPPGDVVANGIFLRDVGLAPADGFAIPGHGTLCCQQRRCAERCEKLAAIHVSSYDFFFQYSSAGRHRMFALAWIEYISLRRTAPSRSRLG